MALFRNKYRIESARLPEWDYSSPGYYFITVCTHDRSNVFGYISNGIMHLNEYGKIVHDEWFASFEIRDELDRDEFTIMPNHFHGIVRIVGTPVETHGCASLPFVQNRIPNAGIASRKPKSISSFMAGVKSSMTKRINVLRKTPGAPVLQYRFHDHVIRNEQELFRIRQYIKNNPLNWHNDTFNTTDNNCVREPEMIYAYETWMI